MKQTWTVYTAEKSSLDDSFDVLANTWTEDGPRPTEEAKVVGTQSTAEQALAMANRMQADYDRLRRTINK